MRKRDWFDFLVVMVLFSELSLSACEATISHFESPRISVEPNSGGPNTTVVINGQGFPPNTAIEIRLGPPDIGASPKSYAAAVTNPEGEFMLTFTMPSNWPDGSPITIKDLVIIAINNDASVKSTALFAYSVKPAPASPNNEMETNHGTLETDTPQPH